MDPCTRFIGKYYKVGDKITVYRIEKMVEVANWFSGMVVPLSVSMLGIYLLTLKKLPIIKRSK
jgi:hypothetical protein